MEIEIITTKKKLSSGLIKQFKRIHFITEIEGAECLGYVINIFKDTYKTYLIRLANGEYRMIEYSWYKYGDCIKLRKAKGVITYNLESEINTDKFIAFLNECNKTNQIFI